MDREILFRGKRSDTREWVEGYVTRIKHTDDKGNIESYYFNALDELGWVAECAVSAETVCQYTGLTDKNGRKIFEGDICKDGDNIVCILWNDKHQWGVEISKTDNVLSRGLIFPLWQYDNCEENGNRQLEVIGNIFDNQELLEADRHD